MAQNLYHARFEESTQDMFDLYDMALKIIISSFFTQNYFGLSGYSQRGFSSSNLVNSQIKPSTTTVNFDFLPSLCMLYYGESITYEIILKTVEKYIYSTYTHDNIISRLYYRRNTCI